MSFYHLFTRNLSPRKPGASILDLDELLDKNKKKTTLNSHSKTLATAQQPGARTESSSFMYTQEVSELSQDGKTKTLSHEHTSRTNRDERADDAKYTFVEKKGDTRLQQYVAEGKNADKTRSFRPNNMRFTTRPGSPASLKEESVLKELRKRWNTPRRRQKQVLGATTTRAKKKTTGEKGSRRAKTKYGTKRTRARRVSSR